MADSETRTPYTDAVVHVYDFDGLHAKYHTVDSGEYVALTADHLRAVLWGSHVDVANDLLAAVVAVVPHLDAEGLEALSWEADRLAAAVGQRRADSQRLVDRWEDDGGAIADAGALA